MGLGLGLGLGSGLGLGLGLEVHALARVLDGEGACEVLDVAFGRRVLVRSRLGFGLWLRARDGVRVSVRVRVRAGVRLRLRA